MDFQFILYFNKYVNSSNMTHSIYWRKINNIYLTPRIRAASLLVIVD